MKIKKSNWMLYFINLAFPETEPKTLCSFFWLFITAVVSTPIILLGLITNIFLSTWSRLPYGGNLALSTALFGATFSICHKFIGNNFLLIYPLELMILLSLLIIIGTIFGVGYLLSKIKLPKSKSSNDYNSKPKKKYILIEAIKGIKNKYCPIIEYED